MKRLDFHVHIESDISTERSAAYFSDMCRRHGYDGVAIMSLYESFSGVFENCNQKALELKSALGNSYAFASLLPNEDFAEQAKRYMQNGFDGIKLIRGGKPNYCKKQGFAYDDARYSEFFAYAEREQIPILAHVNDPAASWDREKASQRAIDMGWVYDESYPSHEYLYSVVDRVLERYPKLNIALAHMGFYSEDLDRTMALLDKYEGLHLDLTPALNIYFEMSQYPQKAKEFFEKYSHRLIFGTDATNLLEGEARAYNDKKNLITSIFFSGEYLAEHTFDGNIIRSLGLSDGILERIYYKNALDFMSAYKN